MDHLSFHYHQGLPVFMKKEALLTTIGYLGDLSANV